MNLTLPGSPMYDIASTTSASIAPYAGVAALAAGVFLGFFVIQFIVDLLGRRYDAAHPAPPGTPQM